MYTIKLFGNTMNVKVYNLERFKYQSLMLYLSKNNISIENFFLLDDYKFERDAKISELDICEYYGIKLDELAWMEIKKAGNGGKKQYKLLEELQQMIFPVFNIIDLDLMYFTGWNTQILIIEKGKGCGMILTLNEEFNLSNLIFQKGTINEEKFIHSPFISQSFNVQKGDFNIVSTGLKVLTDLDYS